MWDRIKHHWFKLTNLQNGRNARFMATGKQLSYYIKASSPNKYNKMGGLAGGIYRYNGIYV